MEETTEPWNVMQKCQIIEFGEKEVCGREFKASSMASHIGHHKRTKTLSWTKDDYAKTFNVNPRIFFAPKPITDAHREKLSARFAEKPKDENGKLIPVAVANATMTSELLQQLSPLERKEYETVFDQAFQQVDRDPIQIPLITSLAFATVRASKLRALTLGKQYRYDELVEKGIAAAQKTISDLSRQLGLDRKSKLEQKTSFKSTPASLIAGYIDELERTSVDALYTMETEEEKALAVMDERIQRIYLSKKPREEIEVVLDDDAGTVGSVPTFDEIVRRADVNI